VPEDTPVTMPVTASTEATGSNDDEVLRVVVDDVHKADAPVIGDGAPTVTDVVVMQPVGNV
jgi:hypothetical protein